MDSLGRSSRRKGARVDGRLAVVAATVVALAFLYYADQVPQIAAALSRIGYPLTRHAVQRILFLIPIGYAALVYGLLGGGITLLLSAVVMMPRVLFLSPTPLDAVSEVGATALAGGSLAWLIDKLGRERLERERSALRLQVTAEVTDLVSRSLEIEETLQQTLHAVLRRLDVGPRGGIFLLDEQKQVLCLRAQHGLSVEFVTEQATVAVGEGLCGAAAAAGEVVWSASCPDDPRHVRQGVSSPHCHLVVPLKARHKVLGVAFFYPHRAIDAEEIRLLASIGELIGAAIQNARLYEESELELERRMRGLALLTDVVEITSHAVEPDSMLSSCLDMIAQFWDLDGPAVHLVDRETGKWKLVYHRSLPAEVAESIKEIPFTSFPLAEIASKGQAMFVGDLARFGPERRQVLERLGRNSQVFVPLKSKDGLIGALGALAKGPQNFTSIDLQLLDLIGGHIASAMERIRLQEEVKRVSALDERDRLARELHDGLAQSLGYLNVQCSHVAGLLSSNRYSGAQEELQQLGAAIRETYDDLREAIFALTPAGSTGQGLIPTILAYLREFQAQSGIETQLLIDDEDTGQLPATTELQLIRVVQEALANVRKHAKAGKATVSIKRMEEEAIITVEDNGDGFDPHALDGQEARHFGLEFMRDRVESVNGTLETQSAPGKGTRVIVRVRVGGEEHWQRSSL